MKKHSFLRISAIVIAFIISIQCIPSGSLVLADSSSNLIDNSGFETGIWLYASTDGLSIDTENKYSGEKSLKITALSSKDAQSWCYVPVNAASTYTYSVWIKTESVTAACIKMRECTSDTDTGTWFGNTANQGFIADSNGYIKKVSGTTDWVHYTVSISGFKSTTKYLKVYCYVPTGIGTAWYDDASLVENLPSQTGTVRSNIGNGNVMRGTVVKLSSIIPDSEIYFTTDGSDPTTSATRLLYSDNYGVIVTENLTVKAFAFSSSRTSEVCVFDYQCDSLIPNGNFEQGLDGWTLSAESNDIVADTEFAYNGLTSAKISSGIEEKLIYMDKIPVNSAYNYKLTLYVKTSGVKNADGFGINIYQFNNSTGIGWYDGKIKSMFVSGYTLDWTEYTVILDRFLDNTTAIGLRARLDAGAEGTAWVDGISLAAIQYENHPIMQIENNTSTVQGNVYTAPLDENISYSLKLSNGSVSSQKVIVTEKLYNQDTNVLISQNQSNLTFSQLSEQNYLPNISAASFYGSYRLDVTVKDYDKMYSYTKSYYLSRVMSTPSTSLTAQQQYDSGFGAATHLQAWRYKPHEVVDQAVNAGLSWLRDGLRWNSVETAKGTYTFRSEVTEYFQYAQQQGINVCLTLAGGNRLYANGTEGDNFAPKTIEQIEAFANYAKAVAEQYKDSIDAIEVWNEWNSSGFNPGFSASTVDDESTYYANLLKAVYNAVKSVAPNIKIVCGGVSGTGITWLRKVFNNNAYNYCDIVSVHPYILTKAPETNLSAFESLKSMMREFGDEKPIWLTEFGYSSFNDSAADFVPGYVNGETNISTAYAGMTEKTMAEYLSRVYILLNTGAVDKVFWYDLVNDGIGPYNKERNFGLSRSFLDPTSPLAAKSPMVAMNAAHSMLYDVNYVGVDKASGSISSYRFRRNTDGELISAYYLSGLSSDMKVGITVNPVSGNVKAYDMYGNVIENISSQSKTIAVGSSPIYLEGNYYVSDAGNLVSNSGFENGIWSGYNTLDNSNCCSVDTGSNNVHSGSSSLKVPAFKVNTAMRWTYVPIDWYNPYHFSAWIKTEDDAQACIKIRECTSTDDVGTWFYPCTTTKPLVSVSNTAGWKRYSFEFRGFKSTTKYLKIYCMTSEGGAGTAWFDDVVLTNISGLKGDVNNDGERNIKDLVRLKRLVAGHDVEWLVYDFDDSGKPDAPDIVLLRKMLIE